MTRRALAANCGGRTASGEVGSRVKSSLSAAPNRRLADRAEEHRAHSGGARAQEMPAGLALQVLHPQLPQQVFFGIHGG
jgi:hypothetical protein